MSSKLMCVTLASGGEAANRVKHLNCHHLVLLQQDLLGRLTPWNHKLQSYYHDTRLSVRKEVFFTHGQLALHP